jgi:chromosomal replication initiation ATPase DnaA
MVAPCNELALGWIDKWPDWPAPALIIYGPEGAGKSHLLSVWAEQSEAIAPENFAGVLPDAVRNAKAIAIDNADGALSAETQEYLFHLYNQKKEQGGSILITARKPPKDWALTLPDLRSRLLSVPAVEVGAPDDVLLSALLVKLFSDRQLNIPEDLIPYLLPRMERSFAAARNLVDALDQVALREKKPITTTLARQVIESL